MARILGINGIHNKERSTNSFTDKMLNAISDKHEKVDVQYPKMWAWLAYFWFSHNRRVKRILKVHKEGDCVVAHSYGCLLTIKAMEKGAKFDKVFFFGAAVNSDYDIPESGANIIYNIYSPHDTALILGKKLPLHEFGGMGLTGYDGKNGNVVNVKAEGLDHNDYAEKPLERKRWVRFIHNHLLFER